MKDTAIGTVTRGELVHLLESDAATVVEALPADAYAADHIPGAVNVPGDLTAAAAAGVAPDPARTVVVYCSGPGCTRSRVVAAAFRRLGYRDVRVYAGGKADWWQAGLPIAGHRAEAASGRSQ